MPQTIEQAFQKLARSKFRSRFHLSPADKEYVNKKGMDTIAAHATDFIRTRLAPALPANDGKQTPMRGHPVFKAQHACACCYRGCLEKWYHVPRSRPLTEVEQQRLVRFLMAWIAREMESSAQNSVHE